jgi:peroxiredoxin
MKRMTQIYIVIAIFLSGYLVPDIALSQDLPVFEAGGPEFGQHLGKGKWLVVKIWASDCHVCNHEAHNYVDYYEFGAGDRTKLVGISLDGQDQQAARDFIQRHDVTYPNFITDFATDSRWFSGISGQAFQGTPGFLIFDPSGVLRAQQIGAVPVELIEQFIDSNS